MTRGAGCGSVPGADTEASATTGRLNITVIVLSAAISVAPSTGIICVTVRKPTVRKRSEKGSASGMPVASRAVAPTETV